MSEKIVILKEVLKDVLVPYKELYSDYAKTFTNESKSVFVLIYKISSDLKIAYICRKDICPEEDIYDIKNKDQFILLGKEINLLVESAFDKEPEVYISPDGNYICITYLSIQGICVEEFEKTMSPVYIQK